MWLINTTTLLLEHFVACPVGTYAVLSHTWEDEELDFDRFWYGHGKDAKGYVKIEHCCKQASADGYKYAWIDTVCIDKRSSTELSEAINSMFAWYSGAQVCYAYLHDFLEGSELDDLDQCRWFTRGWTLQELLAPTIVILFDSGWKSIGTRDILSSRLAKITGIDERVLQKTIELKDCSIAARMSWAAHRVTTRTEDIAYSLLGLFNVNMPLLYGEGQKAFLRLQETIIISSSDESIFAWTGVANAHGTGLLADSPDQFANAADIVSTTNNRTLGQADSPHSITNRGLAIERQLIPVRMNTYISPLKCRRLQNGRVSEPLAIYVCRTNIDDQYRRVMIDGIDLFAPHDWKAKHVFRQLLYFNNNISLSLAPHSGMPSIRFAYLPEESTEISLENLINDTIDWKDIAMHDFRAGVTCSGEQDNTNLLARVGFNMDFEPVILLYMKRSRRLRDMFYFGGEDFSLMKHSYIPFTSNLKYSEIRDQHSLLNNPDGAAWCFKGDREEGLQVTVFLHSDGETPHFFTTLDVRIFRAGNVEDDSSNLLWCVAMREGKQFVAFHPPPIRPTVKTRLRQVFLDAQPLLVNILLLGSIALTFVATLLEAMTGSQTWFHIYNIVLLFILWGSMVIYLRANYQRNYFENIRAIGSYSTEVVT